MARWHWLLSAALAASAISSVAMVQADEGPVSMDQIPAPAQDAIRRHVGMGTLREVVEETGQGGEPVYKGRIDNAMGQELDVWVDAAGNILYVRRPM